MQATTEKQVEILTLAQPESDNRGGNGAAAQDIRHRIARRAAKELKNGFHVNLGIGMPTLVPEHLPPDVKVWLQSENGILGMGPYPTEKQLDACEPLSGLFLHVLILYVQGHHQRRKRDCHAITWSIYIW